MDQDMLYSENLLEGNRSICSFVASHKLRPDENVARNVRFSANFSNGSFSVEISVTIIYCLGSDLNRWGSLIFALLTSISRMLKLSCSFFSSLYFVICSLISFWEISCR